MFWVYFGALTNFWSSDSRSSDSNENLCHLSPKVLSKKKWGKETDRELANACVGFGA